MNVLQGVIQTENATQGVSGLIVLAFRIRSDQSPGQAKFVPLGSVETDNNGRFKLNFEFSEDEKFNNVIIGVLAPEDNDKTVDEIGALASDFNNLEFLFVTTPRPLGVNSTESYSIRISNEKLSVAGVILPEQNTAGSRLALRTKTHLDEIESLEQAVGEAIIGRVADERVLETEFQKEFLPNFISTVQGKNSVFNPDYDYIVGPNDDKSPGELSFKAIKSGIEKIQQERAVGANPAGRDANFNRRRTRFFFTQDQLDQLNDITQDGGNIPADGYKLIEDSALKEILGMNLILEQKGTPLELSKEEVLFDAFIQETVEEGCARQFLGAKTDANNDDPEDGNTDSEPDTTDEEDILKKLTLVTDDIDSPLKQLTGESGNGGIVQSIQDFSVPVGPADEPRIFDFATMQVAFQDVWQSILDARIEPLARSLYTQTNKVLAKQDQRSDSQAFAKQDLNSYGKIKDALNTVKNATSGNSVAGVLARQQSASGNSATQIVEAEIDPTEIGPNFPPGGGTGTLPDGLGDLGDVFESDQVFTDQVLTEGGNSDPNARPEELINQLDKILNEPYEFVAFGADQRSKAINFGLFVGYRHIMTPVTYQAGDLVKSITLAPGESREYSTKTVITRKRAEKELVKNSSIRKDELDEKVRTESEIVRKAQAKTNFSLNTEGTYNLGITSMDATTNSGKDTESQSDEVKKRFREAVIKSSEELRRERSVDVSFEESSSFEETMSGKIENTNQELTVTYLFFELQRRFRVNETIHKATPVILVAQDVPSPNEITNTFLIEFGWIFKRVLLDDSFESALDYVCNSLIGDRLEVKSLLETLNEHRRQVGNLKTQLVALEEQAGRRYEALVQAVKERIKEQGDEETDGFFNDIGDFFGGGGQSPETARLREEAARDAEQRAAQKAKEMATFLQRAVNALNEATENYNKANRRFNNMLLQIAKLRVHIKQNIIYYMQAIWAHEVEDQRFLRLYQTPIPQFSTLENQQTQYKRINEKSGITRVNIFDKDHQDDDENKPSEIRFGVDFEILPSIEVVEGAKADRPLVEVADLNNLLGFMGNYMIFPMKESNALTDLMLNPYLDEGLRLLDPHDPGNITRPQFAEYICKLREQLTDDEFDEVKEDLKTRYRELLLSSEYTGDEIVVPSGALFIEAKLGSKPLIENFKLAHRAFDMVSAQEVAREQALENLRLAARLVDGELSDPDVDAQYNFNGQTANVVVDTPDRDNT